MTAHAATFLLTLTLCSSVCGQPPDCPPPGYLLISNTEGAAYADSLEQRGDWQRLSEIYKGKYGAEADRHRDTEALRVQDSVRCDSIFWAGQGEQKALIFENDELRDNAKRVPWIITLATLIGLVAGLVLAQ